MAEKKSTKKPAKKAEKKPVKKAQKKENKATGKKTVKAAKQKAAVVVPQVDIKTLAAKEMRRLTKILRDGGVSDARIKGLKSVIDNVAWMKVKLDTSRDEIESGEYSGITIEYDNGGGQTGMRENPLFKGYESLWRTYMNGMEKILAAIPDQAEKNEKDTGKPKNVLELVRAKHRKEA